jgi:iron complex transport system ATP-binding protein
MACEYSQRLLALRSGEISRRAIREVLKVDLIRGVFGIDAHILEHPTSGAAMCVPLAAPHGAAASGTLAPA